MNEAIRLDPQLASAYVTRGSAYAILGQFEKAIQDLDEAIRLDPLQVAIQPVRRVAFTVEEISQLSAEL